MAALFVRSPLVSRRAMTGDWTLWVRDANHDMRTTGEAPGPGDTVNTFS
jgi:hypothetical protein